MEKIFDIAKDSEQKWGVIAQGIDRNFEELVINQGNLINVDNVLQNGNFTSVKNLNPINSTISVTSNVLSITGDGTNNTSMVVNIQNILKSEYNFFILLMRVRCTNDKCLKIEISTQSGNRSLIIQSPISNKWYDVAIRCNHETVSWQAFGVKFFYDNPEDSNGSIGQIKDAMVANFYELGNETWLYKILGLYKNYVWWEGSRVVLVPASVKYERFKTKNAYHSKRKPVVSFVNDDGWTDDYKKLVGISQKYSVPFTSAIFDGSTIGEWYCLYLQDELGWEIAAHPRNTALDKLETEDDIEAAMLETNKYMDDRGYKWYNLIYPYGSSDERVRRIAKKYYRCAATTSAGINNGSSVLPSFALLRFPFGYGNGGNNTFEFFKQKVNECVSMNGWLIFMLHPNMPEHTDALNEVLDQLIAYIKSINVDILTLNDGYDIFGNALECGDYIGEDGGVAISFDGKKVNL
jgi:peptidoglycan/xylan/chitin deacetylase (PgdA/CDA1 family)